VVPAAPSFDDTPLPLSALDFDIVVDLTAADSARATKADAHSLAVLAAEQDPRREMAESRLSSRTNAAFGVARMYATYRDEHGMMVRLPRPSPLYSAKPEPGQEDERRHV